MNGTPHTLLANLNLLATASDGVAKNSTFSGFGVLAGQPGRQKMPVVRTPTRNTPM